MKLVLCFLYIEGIVHVITYRIYHSLDLHIIYRTKTSNLTPSSIHSRNYTDRKKKIIKEWTTKNPVGGAPPSPSAERAAAAAAAESATAAAARSVYPADLFYSPHSYIKDEPLRSAADYHSTYAAAGHAAYAAAYQGRIYAI